MDQLHAAGRWGCAVSAREVVARALLKRWHYPYSNITARRFALADADAFLAALAADPGVVERAARALVREQTNGLCEYGKVCGDCDCFPLDKDDYARAHVRAVLAAALDVTP